MNFEDFADPYTLKKKDVLRGETPGALDGSSGGSAIGVPPVVMHGNAELFEEIVRPVLSGQKTACLAITEPYGNA